MSSANPVPETWDLTGSDAKETLQRAGYGQLLHDAFERLRASDGFSHARSMAFVTSLILVQGVIALVGLGSTLDEGLVSNAIVSTLREIFPGPAGTVLTDAVEQAHRAGAQDRWLALFLGLAGTLITGTTLLGQIERAMNRMYGIEQDRPTFRKYGRAFVLAISAGAVSVAGFVMMTLGQAIGRLIASPLAADIWAIIRWPLAFALLVVSTACIYRWSPRRHQPGWSWLAVGAGVSVTLVLVVTLALNGIFLLSGTFGETYGPLAGFVALLLWALLSSIALLLGVGMAAQLEAVRAGVPEPRRHEAVDGPSVRRAPSDAPAAQAPVRANS